MQEDAENTKFRMEQQIQLLEADLTAAKLAAPAASNAAVAADDSSLSLAAKTAAKLETVEMQLAQVQQQNERLSADKYDSPLCIAQDLLGWDVITVSVKQGLHCLCHFHILPSSQLLECIRPMHRVACSLASGVTALQRHVSSAN